MKFGNEKSICSAYKYNIIVFEVDKQTKRMLHF
jgi:hypothetical protein